MTETLWRDTSGSSSSTSRSSVPNVSLVGAIPGLARIAAISGWRIVQWAVTAPVMVAGRIVKAAASGESPAQVLQDATVDLRSMARHALGLSTDEPAAAVVDHSTPRSATVQELRSRGAELLYRSADVWYSGDTHPAYARILDELEPDEARILRFLANNGPQPSIDVRSGRPLGVGSELIASGLSMIGLQSGVRNLARTKADMNNLYRLGLVWFSREQVSDPARYQVVEVQPDVLEALKEAGRAAKTVRRSIHLTPFGEDFCQTCLPLGNGAAPLSRRPPEEPPAPFASVVLAIWLPQGQADLWPPRRRGSRPLSPGRARGPGERVARRRSETADERGLPGVSARADGPDATVVSRGAAGPRSAPIRWSPGATDARSGRIPAWRVSLWTSVAWSPVTMVTTIPAAPARAVRPERWRYALCSAGGSTWITRATSST
jgi:hypothetical protein